MISAAAQQPVGALARMALHVQVREPGRSRETKSVTIIVPTRNEVENIGELVSQIVARAIPFHEILFVDDGSIDGTRDLILSLSSIYSIRLIDQDRGVPGLAAAVMEGARSAEGELLLIMDADLSHPPERINDLLGPLLNGSADMVIGSRYVEGGSTAHWPLWRRTLSRAGSALAYSLTGVRDSMGGFFAIERARLLEITPPAVGFKLAFETIVRANPPLRVREIPIEFRDRVRGQSKMSFAIAIRFFCRWLLAVLRRLLPRDFPSFDKDYSALRHEPAALPEAVPTKSSAAFASPVAIDK
jgi:dolichol-phosphate mannosyltransferase